MKWSIPVCCAIVLFNVGMASAKLPPPTEEQKTQAAAAKAKAAEEAKKAAKALARAQDRAVANYKKNRMPAAPAVPARTVEKLACFDGNEDRHARIGVELINNKVDYFAYYSKWKPRTCSIELKRGGAYGHWVDKGAVSTVTLAEGKGIFLIDGKNGTYRFVFRDIDRGRYCGMDGKINGSLTVTRGRSKCAVEGIMDGHAE